MVGKIMDKDQYSYGFDTEGNAAISSPKALSTRPRSCARRFQGAASVAGLLITTEAMVHPNQGAPAMPGGGRGGMDF